MSPFLILIFFLGCVRFFQFSQEKKDVSIGDENESHLSLEQDPALLALKDEEHIWGFFNDRLDQAVETFFLRTDLEQLKAPSSMRIALFQKLRSSFFWGTGTFAAGFLAHRAHLIRHFFWFWSKRPFQKNSSVPGLNLLPEEDFPLMQLFLQVPSDSQIQEIGMSSLSFQGPFKSVAQETLEKSVKTFFKLVELGGGNDNFLSFSFETGLSALEKRFYFALADFVKETFPQAKGFWNELGKEFDLFSLNPLKEDFLGFVSLFEKFLNQEEMADYSDLLQEVVQSAKDLSSFLSFEDLKAILMRRLLGLEEVFSDLKKVVAYQRGIDFEQMEAFLPIYLSDLSERELLYRQVLQSFQKDWKGARKRFLKKFQKEVWVKHLFVPNLKGEGVWGLSLAPSGKRVGPEEELKKWIQTFQEELKKVEAPEIFYEKLQILLSGLVQASFHELGFFETNHSALVKAIQDLGQLHLKQGRILELLRFPKAQQLFQDFYPIEFQEYLRRNLELVLACHDFFPLEHVKRSDLAPFLVFVREVQKVYGYPLKETF